MRLRTRPLLVGGLDNELYVPRSRLEDTLQAALRHDRNVLLVGERGTGKTTLLRKLIVDSPDREFKIVDATLASTIHDLIRLIGRALGEPPVVAETSNDPVELLNALAGLPHCEGAVIVIDGTLDVDVAYGLFGRLRDQVWLLPNTWIVAATPEDAGALRTPPADAFWSLILELPAMNDREIEELLRRGLDNQELAQLRDTRSTQRPSVGTPRHVVRWAQDVLDGRDRSKDQELLMRAQRLGRQAEMALYELQALDRPTAAGDQELLRRLGWTRATASRWLARMEQAGILRSSIGITQGQGRPPKLYEPVRSQ